MKYQLNLLTSKKQTAIDNVIYFAFHYLRYILVITQFVTICVFFYRFKIDQEIVDSRDILLQRKSIVDATSTLLDSIKELDFKIKNVKQLHSKQNLQKDYFDYFFNELPQDVQIVSLTIEETEYTFQGRTTNIESVRSMYENLQNDKKFVSVTLSNVAKSEQGYTFQMHLSNVAPKNGQNSDT